MPTIRKPLSKRQFEIYVQVRDAYQEAARVFRAAEERFNTAAALLLDFHGLDLTARAVVDDKTSELVVEVPESPKPEPPKPEPVIECAPASALEH